MCRTQRLPGIEVAPGKIVTSGPLRPRAATRIGLRSLIRAIRHTSNPESVVPEMFEKIQGLELEHWQQQKSYVFLVDSREAARYLSFQLSHLQFPGKRRQGALKIVESSYKWRSAREWMSIRSNLRLIYETHNYRVGYSCSLETCIQRALESENLELDFLSQSLGQSDFQQFKRISTWMGVYSDWDALIIDIDDFDSDYRKPTIESLLRLASGRPISVITRSKSFAEQLLADLGISEFQSYGMSLDDELSAVVLENQIGGFDDDSDDVASNDLLPSSNSPFSIQPTSYHLRPDILIDKVCLNGVDVYAGKGFDKSAVSTLSLGESEKIEIECRTRVTNWNSEIHIGLVLKEPPADVSFLVDWNSIEQLSSEYGLVRATILAPQLPNRLLGIGLALCSANSPSEYFSLKKILVVTTKSTQAEETVTAQIQSFGVASAV